MKAAHDNPSPLWGMILGVMLVTPALHAATMDTFKTLDNQLDPTFNQLLGINNTGTIAGYFGSGLDAAHPNKGSC